MRIVPLVEEAIDALESAQADFSDVFGRPPHEDDPVFLVKYLSSESDFIRETAEVMERSEIRPELIYQGHFILDLVNEFAGFKPS